jgi:hypothetical protein
VLRSPRRATILRWFDPGEWCRLQRLGEQTTGFHMGLSQLTVPARVHNAVNPEWLCPVDAVPQHDRWHQGHVRF